MHMTTGIARYMRLTISASLPPIPTRSPRSNELPIGRQRAETVEKSKERGKGPDRRVRSIQEIAEDMLRTLEELKAEQRGSQQEEAAAGHV